MQQTALVGRARHGDALVAVEALLQVEREVPEPQRSSVQQTGRTAGRVGGRVSHGPACEGEGLVQVVEGELPLDVSGVNAREVVHVFETILVHVADALVDSHKESIIILNERLFLAKRVVYRTIIIKKKELYRNNMLSLDSV